MAKEDGQQSTIKIKLNGKERPFEEKTVVHDWQAASEETSAASSEEMLDEEEFEWILPNEEEPEIPEFKVNHHTESKKRPNIHRFGNGPFTLGIKRTIISFVLAITVGLLLGTFFLQIMKREDIQATTTAQNQVAAEDKPGEEKKTGAGYEATLPAMAVPVLQAGVYSSKENAESAAKELTNQNYATTILEMDGKYNVFIGVAGELQEVESWEKNVKESGLDVLAKELSLKESSIKLATKEQAEQLLKEVNYFKTVAGEAVKGEVGGDVNEKVSQNGLQLIDSYKDGVYQNKEAVNLQEQLQAALKGLENSSENKEEAIKVQQSLLNYITIYYQLSSHS
ncbi:hypothetical protein J14TS2_15550 [Bacillus sp. J14TS2]|uniref:SPOR domain-containing protein n=1 Tax=Bacillus sp. J14TS2 TaxID=2807188 RepID=UPI001B1DC169|nr:SPOR domain-containing protein [Bacillus sp. J14TS2]GIN71080.1 hypothetical protein J14TS2_15550 [Bacillus sp. J14TS2]